MTPAWLPILIKAITLVENASPDAIRDSGRAYGILCITQDAVTDVNDYYGTEYVHEDAFNPDVAREIAKFYIHRWGINNGHGPVACARIYNGGPAGWQKKSTADYGLRVLNIMRALGYRGEP